MSPHNSLHFSLVPWHTHRDLLMDVRIAVFVQEQAIDISLEVDQHDATCLHLLGLTNQQQPAACGRLILHDNYAQIGRLAVKKPWRGQGWGGVMLERLCQESIQRGYHEARLTAQVRAIGFYQKYGFKPYGEVFLDAEIPHQWMKRAFEL